MKIDFVVSLHKKGGFFSSDQILIKATPVFTEAENDFLDSCQGGLILFETNTPVFWFHDTTNNSRLYIYESIRGINVIVKAPGDFDPLRVTVDKLFLNLFGLVTDIYKKLLNIVGSGTTVESHSIRVA